MGKISILVAVSGGPDSTYLLNMLIKKNTYNIVAVHINYHLRHESDNDEKVIRNFCKKNNIKIEVLNVNDRTWKKVSYLKNKQSMYREIRFLFFKKISDNYKINKLYLGHNKDDWIETAIMQKEKSNDLLFYGIKEISKFNGMKIIRPILYKYKNDIENELYLNKIKYCIDSTNDEPIYKRNKLRIDLSKISLEAKEKIFDDFNLVNIKHQVQYELVKQNFNNWKKTNYSWIYFMNISESNKKYVVYQMLIHNKTRINISTNKLEAIINFLKIKNGNKSYRLMEKIFLTIKDSKIIIYKK